MSSKPTFLVIADANPEMTRTLTRAGNLAEQMGARLSIMGFAADASDESFEPQLRATAKRALGDFTDYSVDTGLANDIVGSVKSLCAEGAIDLVIKTTHHSEKILHTPTDWQLIRELSTPILLLTAKRGHKKIKTILAAVDLQSQDAGQQALDHALLAMSAKWAEVLGATLHGASCISTSQALTDLDLQDPRKREDEVAPVLHNLIATWTDDYGITPRNWHIHAGVTETVIEGIASGVRADLVVLGSVGRKKLQGLFLGNTAERILKTLPTNILVVKPAS